MSTFKEKQLRRTVIEQAADWHRRHRDDTTTATEREEFLEWLRASPQNTHEYLAVAGVWGGFEDAMADLRWNKADLVKELAEAPGTSVHALAPQRPERRAARRGLKAGLIAASLLIAAFAIYQFAPASLTGRPQVITASADKPDRVRLDDGSVLHLNASARVEVRYSAGQRRIDLDRGEAFFDVAHQAQRPFRVRVGDTDVIAVGTQFDVARRADDSLTITVVQGKVDVVPDAASAHNRPVRLKAGEQIRIDGHSRTAPAMVDLREVTAWMRYEVIFDGHPLSQAVQQFNRYLDTPIEIEDPALGPLQISGVFDAYDVETFLALLGQYNIHIERRKDVIKISSK